MQNSTFLKKAGIMAVLLFSIYFGASALQSTHSNLNGNNENIGNNNSNYFHATNSSEVNFSFHTANFKNGIAQKSPGRNGDFIPHYIYNIIYRESENAKPIYFSNDMVKTDGIEKPANIRDANGEVGLFSFIENIVNHHSKTI